MFNALQLMLLSYHMGQAFEFTVNGSVNPVYSEQQYRNGFHSTIIKSGATTILFQH